jgi:hypothetical protein
LHSLFVIPAAGGYDALWVLVIDVPGLPNPAPAQKIDALWQSWTAMSVCPLSARAEPSGGLRVEDIVAGRKQDSLESARPSLTATVGTLLLSVAFGSLPFWARA